MSSVIERISSALSSLGKRRDRDGNGAAGGTPPPSAGGSASRPPKRFRPWEQADLHRRLDSYSPLTWFAKPASVGPVPCALRGWVNEACDTLTCEHCGAKLVWPPNVPYDQRQAAADLFSPALTTKHSASCPWRQTHCNESLLVYQPSHSNDEMVDLFNSLHSKLLRVEVLPELDAIAIQAVRNAASPYGPYDQLVLGVPGRAAGAADGNTAGGDLGRRRPQVTMMEVDKNGKEVPIGGAGGEAEGADGPTILLQPSKLTPQQKAKLLALLGWHVDVIQPDSAGGTAAAPYAQSTTYSLQHLGIGGSKGGRQAKAAGAQGMAASGSGKYPMSQVVLRCPHCNGKMGLWNFAGVRPVPSGRLTPATSVGAAGIAGLRAPVSPAGAIGVGGWATPTKGTPLAASGASFVGTTISMPPPASPIGGLLTAAPAAADPLAVTIAGGNYAAGGGTPLRPFGYAAASQPAFGGFGASQPVFGTAALDAEAAAKRAAGAAPSFADIAAAAAAAATASAAGVGVQNPTAMAAPVQGQKRKAESEPEAMAVDGEEAGAGHDGKRARVYSGSAGATASVARGSGPAAASGTAAASGGELKQLDPVAQHRSWCPWVFTGTGEQRHMNGWQHMLSALTSQEQQAAKAQQQQQQQAAAGKTAGTSPAPPGSAPTSGVDARLLKDQVVANIRAL